MTKNNDQRRPTYQGHKDSDYRKKLILKLHDDEVAVVWTREHWEHLIMVYETMADEALPHEQPFWFEAAEHIRQALKKVERNNYEQKRY